MAGISVFLQNELVTLSSESRKRQPNVKDAAEQALVILRTLKDLPQEELCSELSKNSSIIVPFELACRTKNARLVAPAVSALSRLVAASAISDEKEIIHRIVSSLADVASLNTDTQLKILQTALPLVKLYSVVHGELLSQAMQLCFQLLSSRDNGVANSAAATLRQLFVFLFDKVAAIWPPDSKIYPILEKEDHNISFPVIRDAELVFTDICRLASGDVATFLVGVGTLNRSFLLELFESVLRNHVSTLRNVPVLRELLRRSLAPLIVRALSERVDFPQSVRLLRVLSQLLKNFHDILTSECEVALKLTLKLISNDNPNWLRALALETFEGVVIDHVLLCSIFEAYDCQKNASEILTDLLSNVNRIVQTIQDSSSVVAIKVSCLEQLDKNDSPPVPEEYVTFLSAQIVLSTCASIVAAKEAPKLVSEILKKTWPTIHGSLRHLASFSPDAVFHIKNMSILCSNASIFDAQDAFLVLLTPVGEYFVLYFQSLLEVVIVLSDKLANSWKLVVEIFSLWDRLRKLPLHSTPTNSQISAVTSSTLVQGIGNKRIGALAQFSASEVSSDQLSELDKVLEGIFESSIRMSEKTFSHLLCGLCGIKSHSAMFFAVEKLKIIVNLNLPRLLEKMPAEWVVVVNYFLRLSSSQITKNIGSGSNFDSNNSEIINFAAAALCEIVSFGFMAHYTDMLFPLYELAKLTGEPPRLALNTLCELLTKHGGSIISDWQQIYVILQHVANDDLLVRPGFQSLELLCSEYLSQQPPALCVQTLGIYTKQTVEFNIALTCVRLLWTVADALHDAAWLNVLHKLLEICHDSRPEVRNSCVTSLFRSISGGRRQKNESWDLCYREIVVPILKQILSCPLNSPTDTQELIKDAEVVKLCTEWDETRKLVLSGMCELLVGDLIKVPQEVYVELLLCTSDYAKMHFTSVRATSISSFLQIAAAEGMSIKKLVNLIETCCECIQFFLLNWGLLHEKNIIQQESVVLLASTIFLVLERSQTIEKATDGPIKLVPIRLLPSNTIFERLQDLLKLDALASASAYEDDTKKMTSLQREVIKITRFIEMTYSDNNDILKFFAKILNKITEFAEKPVSRQATFHALGEEIIPWAGNLIKSDVSPEIVNDFLKANEIFFCSAGPLHYSSTELYHIIVEHYCALECDSEQKNVIFRLGEMACNFFNSRNTCGSDEEDEKNDHDDEKVLKQLTRGLARFLQDDQRLRFFTELELSTRFSVVTPLDLGTERLRNRYTKNGNGDLNRSTVPRVREVYSMTGLRELFWLCGQHGSAVEVGMLRTKNVFSSYISEKRESRIPLPRLREVEIRVILEELEKLQCPVDANFLLTVPEDLRRSSTAHLYSIYGWLLTSIKYMGDQPDTLDLVCQCLLRCGEGLGLHLAIE